MIPVTPEFNNYAQRVRDAIWAAGYYADFDDGRERFQKKIAIAQTSQYNFILIVGDKEQQNGTVNVRPRSGQEHYERTVPELLADFNALVAGHQ